MGRDGGELNAPVLKGCLAVVWQRGLFVTCGTQ